MQISPQEVALQNMDAALNELTGCVAPPKDVLVNGMRAYRYVEQTTEQAIILKLVRYVSGLRACQMLLDHGFVQELGVLQRVLTDIEEDVTFLACSIIFNNSNEFHRRFLATFWQEEFDMSGKRPKSVARDMVPRSKIRAYNAAAHQMNLDPSTTIEVIQTVSSVYSGFVHAPACHVMELYAGNPPSFHTNGMLRTGRQDEHCEDLWNQFYRGILLMAEASTAFGHQTLQDALIAFSKQFAASAGRDYSHL